jgi:ketosteroid isomerase-like protein
MSEQHKATLQQANAAITEGDIEGFLAHCTDDIRWTTVGEPSIEGKEAVRRWMAREYVKPPPFTISRLIVEGDFLVALGEITTDNDDGTSTAHAYCDVWRFRDGKMSELQAFVV